MSEKSDEKRERRATRENERVEWVCARMAGCLSAIVAPMAHAGLLAEHVTLEANAACSMVDDLLRDFGVPGSTYQERLAYVMDREQRRAMINGKLDDGRPGILGADGKPVGRG